MEDKLMNGLKLVEVYDVKDWNWELFVICGAFFLAGILFIILEEKFDFCFFDNVGALFIGGSLVIAVIVFAFTLYHNFFGATREFKVTCDESVSFLDIEDEYDVIAYDGEVYTIREEVDY